MAVKYTKYKVTIKTEVFAEKEEDVLKEAVREVKELYAQGELTAKIKKEKSKKDVLEKADILEEFKSIVVKMALNNANTKDRKRYKELQKIISEKIN